MITTSAGPAIRVQGLEKSYGKLEVLRGVDFDVARGSIFSLLGSNGSGKTTTVRILATLLTADAGTASVNGFDVATQSANVRETISLTGQFAAVDEILSGRENLVLVAKLRHLEDPGAIADDLLDRFSLSDAAHGQGARRLRHDGAAHHAVPGRGRTSRRPDRDPARGPDHRERHPRRAQAAPPARQRRVRREAADLGGRLLRTRREGRDDDQAFPRRHRCAHGSDPAPYHPQHRHHHHDRRHADRHDVDVRLRIRRRDRHRVGQVCELHAARHPAHHDRVGHLLADLLDATMIESAPGAKRLLAILEERGWRGWTRIERVPADSP